MHNCLTKEGEAMKFWKTALVSPWYGAILWACCLACWSVSCVGFDRETLEERRCVGEGVCAQGFRCLEGYCVAPEVSNPFACTPGISLCNGSISVPCGADGVPVNSASTDCAATGQICFAGQCQASCPVGQGYCTTVDLQVCAASDESVVLDPCGAYQSRCEAGACVPIPVDVCPIVSIRGRPEHGDATTWRDDHITIRTGQTLLLDGSTSTALVPGETIGFFDWFLKYSEDEVEIPLFFQPLPRIARPTFSPTRTGNVNISLRVADTTGMPSCEVQFYEVSVLASTGLRIELDWQTEQTNNDFDLHLTRSPGAWNQPFEDCFYYTPFSDWVGGDIRSSPSYINQSPLGNGAIEQIIIPSIPPGDVYHIGVQAYDISSPQPFPARLRVWLDDKTVAELIVPPLNTGQLWEAATIQINGAQPIVTPVNNVIQAPPDPL